MIIYQSTKDNFLADVRSDTIDKSILNAYFTKTGKHVGQAEKDSWKRSMRYMRDVLVDPEIPSDSGVTIEYQIPQTSKRIDFILTGQDEKDIDYAVLIELKQWTEAKLTAKDGVVHTDFYGDVSHPSYQVWSYAALLQGFNETVYNENIQLRPCAYLHNYIADDVITNQFYSDYTTKAPVFLEGDAEKEKLKSFIKKFVKFGDKSKVMYRIDGGKIKPSKSLADSLVKMLKGNKEFVMVDDQKIVYESALALAKRSSVENKNVLIVQGGPGTGKSVVAVNLLVDLTKLGLVSKYVTKNAAPRAVYESMLTGVLRKTEISNLFSGSGTFIETEANTFDVLIVDEAHRLNEKSGMYRNQGVNQIKEIIEASKFSVFFVDEDQKVTWSDIGEKEEIKKWADKIGAIVSELELTSQFRCNGSDGYLAWLDDVLQVKDTANTMLDPAEYDFQVVDSPAELRDIIFEKNIEKNKARLVAGYCWNWVSRNDPGIPDITFPEYGFEMQWNLAIDGNLWILKPEAVTEVGCIHTCQGLDLDYVGVIVGPDLIVRDEKVLVDPSKRAGSDASLKGYKTYLKQEEKKAQDKIRAIIKNTYRTLMTRGMKGCYVYFTDKETAKYFKSRIGVASQEFSVGRTDIPSPYIQEFIKVPLLGSVPCGSPFEVYENIEKMIPVPKAKLKRGEKYFIVRATGDSMDKVGINDGDLVLCRHQKDAEDGNKVVVLTSKGVTIKELRHEGKVIVLYPKSTNSDNQPILLTDEVEVQGVVVETIKM
jgi:hypothetical protein